MGRLRAADFDDCIVQSQSCSWLSTPRSQGYLDAVARAKEINRHEDEAAGAEIMGSAGFRNRLQEKRGTSRSLILLAFDAKVKEPYAHGAMVWAMENTLKRGDTLAIVAVCTSVRGPLGYRVKIGDENWLSANRTLVEHERRRKLELWTAFPGLQHRCHEGGVKLMVLVKTAQRPEVAIVTEAVALGATHVVLDKSLKNRRRQFYVENLSCGVTRMRKSGGVEAVRAPEVVHNHTPSPSSSPTSVLTPFLGFRYGYDLDVFETSLQPKRTSASRSVPATATSSLQSRRSSNASQPATTSASSNFDLAMDDDLFSIFHFGSPQHDTEFIDAVLQLNTRSGYESDEPELMTTRFSPPEPLTRALISRLTFVVGLGNCVEIHLRSALRPGEGLLVGASPSALFLLQQVNESSPRVLSVGTPACYIAMEGGMTMRLAHVESGQRVLAVDCSGRARTIAVGHAIMQSQPLVLVEASHGDVTRRHSVMLHHSQSICLSNDTKSLSLKRLLVGDKVLLRLRPLNPS